MKKRIPQQTEITGADGKNQRGLPFVSLFPFAAVFSLRLGPRKSCRKYKKLLLCFTGKCYSRVKIRHVFSKIHFRDPSDPRGWISLRVQFKTGINLIPQS